MGFIGAWNFPDPGEFLSEVRKCRELTRGQALRCEYFRIAAPRRQRIVEAARRHRDPRGRQVRRDLRFEPSAHPRPAAGRRREGHSQSAVGSLRTDRAARGSRRDHRGRCGMRRPSGLHDDRHHGAGRAWPPSKSACRWCSPEESARGGRSSVHWRWVPMAYCSASRMLVAEELRSHPRYKQRVIEGQRRGQLHRDGVVQTPSSRAAQ